MTAGSTEKLGEYLRDVFRSNEKQQHFRLYCPEETSSNKLDAVFEATERCWQEPVQAGDENYRRKDG